MHRDDHAIVERLERYLRHRLPRAVESAAIPVDVSAWTVSGEPVPFERAVKQQYSPLPAGTPWGRPWDTTWLRFDLRRPAEWRGRRFELRVELGFSDEQTGFQAEGLAYDAHGAPVKGVHPASRWVPVPDVDESTIYVEAASNPVVLHHDGDRFDFSPTPLGEAGARDGGPQYVLGRSALVVRDETVAALVLELRLLGELAAQLPERSPRRAGILRGLDRALTALDSQDIAGTATAARAELKAVLASPAEQSAHRLSAVGHAHIDSAWVWPFRETRRKVARTVANVLERMAEDPDLIFAMSSAQQYAWLQEDHPKLFERLRERVAQGRFLPVGGMWVESDVNMPSGEALVRQFTHGTRYFESEFGVPTTIAWLPDSFGYSAALPQLIRSIGARRFLTQKISWNETNRFPHHTFWWEGIDGSRVFAHFPSADMYNSALTGPELHHAAVNFADRGRLDRSLIPFGYGDGGGGPTREMLDRARLAADLEGSPRVAIETPDAFFEASQREYPDAPVWLGEMYLEFHRGTLTSQARTKQGNRRAERLFREAELWLSTAAVLTGSAYPYEELEQLWRELLLMQFHDVLPGTSIAWVHEEAESRLAHVATRLEEYIRTALDALGGGEPSAQGALVANASPVSRDGIAPHGIGVPRAAHDSVTVERLEDGHFALANGRLRVVVGPDGTVNSLVDAATGREAVPDGQRMNQLQLHPDAPPNWDAWDLDAHPGSGVVITSTTGPAQVSEAGDGSVSVTVERAFGRSTARQTTTLRPGSARVDFATEVDWHESERLLKVAFPTTTATDRWAAETQFGYLWRPTHTNTSWEAAQFEACAHRWVLVREPNFGVAVVNEHTYGHDVTRGGDGDSGTVSTTVRLSLLRSPRYPDPHADQGRHRFHYAVVPGADVADAVREGYAVTDAARPVRAGESVRPLVSSSEEGILIDTVKMADDRSGDVIVRIFEAHGTRHRTTLSFGFPVASVTEVDLMERPSAVGPENGPVDLADLVFTPFRLRTFRITRSEK
ncbi:alpha-mannosidase [Streptomyces sp. NPDC088747]|uniref:alpha-mannosidase n=1 Tax=Streptomyces sp. NPDC088747 TaxID=3365886 RepID=UPI0038058595